MLKETKGYTKLRGKIWGLNKKEIFSNDYTKDLSFGLNTSKDNSVFVGINTFKESKDVYVKLEDGSIKAVPFSQRKNLNENEKLIGVNIKSEGQESTITLCELDALEYIKKNFKDGQSVFIKCTNKVDAYRKSLKTQIQQIYVTDEPIEFDSETYREVNDIVQEVVMLDKDNAENCEITVAVVDKNFNVVELTLRLANDEDVIEFFKSCKKGDLLKVAGRMVRKPIYKDGQSEKAPSHKTSLIKGRNLGGTNYAKRAIDGYEEYIEIYDVESREERKYSREDFAEMEELKLKKENEKAEKKAKAQTKIDLDNDMPF